MKLKKFTAPTMSQAIAKVKKELGNDAVIFHTKKVTTGRFFNLIKREHIEVIAASDPDPVLKEPRLSAEKIHRKSADSHVIAVPSAPLKRRRIDKYFSGPDAFRKIETRLSEQGLKPEHVDLILKGLVKKWYKHDESLSEPEMNQILKASFVRLLHPERFGKPETNQRLIMLLGPTGVGKTTTIAKLAGRDVLGGGKQIALVSTDTFRVAAISQLKTYADLLSVPVDVAYSAGELKPLLVKYSGCDRIYIDTAGRNFQHEAYVRDLASMIRDNDQIRPYLTLAATAKYADLNRLIRSFDGLPVDQLILTKMDETTTYGAIVSTLIDFPEKQIVCVTNGQEVPDDLQAPDVTELINLMLGDTHDK
ncbi:flagellar biosynthesis regulator FlhF [Sporolactobacillus vineae]|uniref:flagellar biosynthesis protein FlhF n=1 Tax=Sporolactobacillus vineae TaxID=444463 RepID=UPI000289B318|nr:flagellar biosynthesis regulator FlhF [Sporolactobacillus vineae]